MRKALLVAGLTLGSLLQCGVATAQDYPTREIKLICGFPAGSGADVIYRYLAQQLQVVSGKTFVVENKPGAAGHIATTFVARSKPDGYTILPSGGTGMASMMSVYKTPPVDPLKDFDFIGTVLKQGWYLVVDAKSPIRTLGDLTAHLKRKGADASYATSTNVGTVFAETYLSASGLSAVRVNYKTINDTLNDLAAGNVDFVMADPAFTIGNIRNGRVRALAVSTGERIASTPDIPTIRELGVPNLDLTVWWSVEVPAGTPKQISDQIGKWFEQVLRMEETRKFFTSIGTDVFISSAEETRALLLKDIENWRDYVRRAKIDPS